MADRLIRYYRYTGQAAWKTGDCAVPLSAFDVSGATEPIYEIYTIALNWYRKHSTRATVQHSAALVLADGTEYLSAVEGRQGSGKIFPLYGELSGISAADFVPENIAVRTTTDASGSSTSWIASEAYPMELVVIYSTSDFKPGISDVKLYRADALGNAADDGTNLSLSALLAVEKIGTNGAGVLRMYEDGVLEPLILFDGIEMEAGGVPTGVGAMPIPDLTIGAGEKKWYTLEFAYTAQNDDGAEFTETASARVYVGGVFTNVHLAGVSTGGVRFGGYSTAAEGAPKFECDYPAYLYGGIAQIGEGVSMLPELGIQTGSSEVQSISSGAVRIVEVTFDRTYALPPLVLVSLCADIAGYALGRCSASVQYANAGGFTAVIANYSGSAQDLGLNWAAFGMLHLPEV